MTTAEAMHARDLAERLSEAEATIATLLADQDNAVLQGGQKRLRDLIDNLGPSMFVGLMTPSGVMLEANRSALEASGLSRKDVLGKRFDGTFWWDHPGNDRQLLREAIERAARGEASHYDTQVRAANGRLLDIDFSLQPLRGASGAVVFLVPSGTVITERKRIEATLRESNDQFHQLADNITDVFWIRSPDMAVLHYISPGFERIWGRSADSLRAHPERWIDYIVPEDRQVVSRAFQALRADAPSLDLEYRIARPNDEIRWVHSRGFQVRDAAGTLVRLIGIITDITDRKQAAEALRASLDDFQMLAEAMPQLVWITRPDGWNIYFNQQWMDYTGLTDEESHGHGWSRPFHPDDQERATRAWEQATESGGTYSLEGRLRRADGVYRWWLVRGVPLKDAAGSILKWFGTCTDIHDLKIAQLEISRTNRALTMLSRCSEAVIRAESELALLNEVCRIAVEDGSYRAAWVGYAQDDEARSITPMAHSGVDAGFLSAVKVSWHADNPLAQGPAGQVIRTGQAVVCEDLQQEPRVAHWLTLALERGYRGTICLPLREGTRTFGLLVLYSAQVTHTSPEELTLLGQMADDVGFGIVNLRAQVERRRLEAAVLKAAALESQLMVSDRMASVGTLAAGVAHEINNPLAAVIANLDYIAESLEGGPNGGPEGARPRDLDAWAREDIKSPLEDARHAAQRVRLIVRDLKVFSRSPESDPRAAVDVHAVMESSLRMAWNEIRHRARLVKHFGRVPSVAASEARLGQVFLNLLVNAAQALPEGQAENNEIRVTTRLDGERVVIEVADTGPGIPPETIGRIFDAFFTTKAVGVGTGLGLAISHRIVTDMGGELTVESVVGTGTTFRVALPVALVTEPEPTAPAELPVETGRRGHILLVDDDKLVLSILARVLSKEHDVVPLLAAKDALARCAAGETFDLIFCDLMMPEMTGMDLYQELSRVAPEQAQRMIFLTGGAFTAAARQFLSETSREHIEKPFDPANLRAIVRRYLR